jgi:hypothetical protein
MYLCTDVFSQISDTAGVMEWTKFVDYLREALALPTAVFEGPTFGYTDLAAKACFDVRLSICICGFKCRTVWATIRAGWITEIGTPP